MSDIPAPLAPDDTPPIRTADDLHLHWRRLMGELGFGSRSLWVTILDPADRVLPTLPRVDELPKLPPELTLRRFVRALADGLGGPDGGWSVGFLLSRPGPGRVTGSDLRYLDVLTTAGRSANLSLRPTFLATSAAVVGLEIDQAA